MRKWLISALCGLTFATLAYTSEIDAAFKDLPEDNYFSTYVYDLVERGQISGYPDGTFRTNVPVTRAEATQMLANYSGRQYAIDVAYKNYVELMKEYEELYPNVDYVADFGLFPDVALGKWYFNAVHSIASDGIVNGYEDGTFKPEGFMTRGEVAKVIRGIVRLDLTGSEDGIRFEDTAGHFAEEAINELSSIGLFLGRDGKRFAPNDQVTRGELAVILYRLNAHQDLLLTGKEVSISRSFLLYDDLEELFDQFGNEVDTTQPYTFLKGTEMSSYLTNYSFSTGFTVNETSNYIVKHFVNAVCPDVIKQAIYEDRTLKLNEIRHDFESLQKYGEPLMCPDVVDISLEVIELPGHIEPTSLAKMSVPYITETSLNLENIIRVQK